MSADLHAMFGGQPSVGPDTEAAFMLGLMFKQLGGEFVIDTNGKRRMVRGFEPVYPAQGVADWERVIGMVEGMLKALCPADKAFLFDAFALCEPDPATVTATVSEPTRRVA